MSSLQCKCGFILSSTKVPNDVQYHVYSDFEWHEILSNDVVETWKLPRPKNDVWKCPNCSRIYVLSDDGTVIKKYKIEDD